MTFRCGGILRQMDAGWYRRQQEHVREALAIAERQATPEEITKAAALLATEPSARQQELKLK